MGTWSTEILGNDNAMDLRNEFMELYNRSEDLKEICSKIEKSNYLYNENDEVILEENTDCWLAYALCLWECKFLSKEVLDTVENIVTSGIDIENWKELDADSDDIESRSIVLKGFLKKLV